MGIRHAVLDQGAVYYNNRQSVLSADLHNVDFRASFDSLLQKYSGKLSYADGHLQSGTFKPIPHNLDAEFDATPTTFHLTKAKLTSDTSQLLLTATVQDYSHPRVQAEYAATLDGSQFRRVLQNPTVPTGLIRASGSVAYQEVANRSFLDTVLVRGDLSSRQLDVQTPTLRSQIRDIAAHYSLENGDATLQDFRASDFWRRGDQLGQDEQHRRQCALKIQWQVARHPAGGSEPRSEVFSDAKGCCLGGVLNADANAAWGKTFDDVVAQVDAGVQGKVTGNAQVIPIESTIHGSYTGGNQELTLKQSFLRTPQSTLTMNGVVSQRSSLDLKFQSNNLSELETIADLFRAPTPGQPVPPLGLAGLRCFRVRFADLPAPLI